MATVQLQEYSLRPIISYSPKLLHFKNPNSVSYSRKLPCSKKIYGFLRSSYFRSIPFHGSFPLCQYSKESGEIERLTKEQCESVNENEKTPFDINLAVILAGFAFEAYTTPPVKFSALSCLVMFCYLSYLETLVQ